MFGEDVLLLGLLSSREGAAVRECQRSFCSLSFVRELNRRKRWWFFYDECANRSMLVVGIVDVVESRGRSCRREGAAVMECQKSLCSLSFLRELDGQKNVRIGRCW